MEDTMRLNGSVRVKLTDSDGKIKQQHETHNLVVTVGKSYLATWLAAASQAGPFMSYIAVGTGVIPPANGDTVLGSEITGGGNTRVLGSLTPVSNTWNNSAIFIPGNCTGAITEAGLFSTITGGTLFSRQTFGAYNKAAGDTLTISWTLTIS